MYLGISENFPERTMYITGAYYLNEFQSKHLLYFTHRKTRLYETEKAQGQLCWTARQGQKGLE